MTTLAELRTAALLNDDERFHRALAFQYVEHENGKDWRNYITDEIEDVWHTLGPEAKIVAYLMATIAANKDTDPRGEDW